MLSRSARPRQRIPLRHGPRPPGSARRSIAGRHPARGMSQPRLHRARRSPVLQIAICAVLVTSSLVAVRGLVRSLHSTSASIPRTPCLLDTDLHMAGYSGDRIPAMQRRMIDAVSDHPRRRRRRLIDASAAAHGLRVRPSSSPTHTTDFRPTNAAADAMTYSVSPGYFEAAGTRLARRPRASPGTTTKTPRASPWSTANSRVKVFGSRQRLSAAISRYWDGNALQVIGVVEDGKYAP